MTTHAGLVGFYSYPLVALSIFIAILAAYAALDLAGRITSAQGLRRFIWLCGGAIAMGSGIWAMHYVGMEAFRLPVPVLYDWPTVLLSLLAAIVASGIALHLVSRPTMTRLHKVVGSIVMGLGIVEMHYIGMDAMRLPAMCVYSAGLVTLSVALAIAISYLALLLAFVLRDDQRSVSWRRTDAALVLGSAIPVMHYVGMAAVTFVPTAGVIGSLRHAVTVSNLSLSGIVMSALVLLAIVIVSSSVVRQRSAQERQFKDNLERLRAVFDSMTDAVIVVDFEKGTVEHNRAATTLLGFAGKTSSLEENSSSFEFFLPTGAPLPAEDWPTMRARRGDFCTNVELLVRRKNTGTLLTTEITTVPIAAAVGKGSRVILSVRDVGPRMLAEELIRHQKAQLQNIFDNLNEGVVLMDTDVNIIQINRVASRLLGITLETSSRENLKKVFEVMSPNGDLIPHDQWVSTLASKGEFFENREFRVRRTDTGSEIIAQISSAPVLDSSGKTIQFIVSYRDITHTKKADEERKRLAAIVDFSLDAIIGKDDKGIITSWNAGATKVFGYSAAEIIGQSITLLLPKDRLNEETEILARIKRGELVDHFETVRARKDGRHIHVSLTISPIRDAQGNVIGASKIARDITQRKLAEASHARLFRAIEQVAESVVITARNGSIIYVNPAFEKVSGYTQTEVIGHNPRLLKSGKHPPSFYEEMWSILNRGETWAGTFINKRKDGKLIHEVATISPIRDEQGEITNFVGVERDVTHELQLQRQLQQSQKMDAIGQLTGGVAHDFNNLLGIVIGNLDLLERAVADDEAALKRVQTAQKAALRGADLTRRLLAFSSNEALSPAPNNLHHLIRNMIEMTGHVIGPGINITTRFHESLSQILIDATGLESALVNLVVNARDAMPKGGCITISTDVVNLDANYPPVQAGELQAGRYACISVSDSGEGMSKQTLERVFEPFFTTKPRGKGTGLGLAMVYGFVKQSHGTVRIYSEFGYGTTVTLYLPLTEDASLPAPESVEPHISFDGNATVLVVDDEVDLLDIATAYLASMGCKAFTAVDANDALQILEKHQDIDLMLTDIIMPGGMNGVELANKVRQLNPEIKIIYCSGFPADALAERSLSLVDGPLLRKPYQRDEFIALVRRILENGTEDAP